MQRKRFEHITRVVRRGIHSRHAGILLGAERLDQRAEQLALDVARHQMLEHPVSRGHILHRLMIGAVLARTQLPRERIDVQREQLLHARLEPHGRYHFRVDDINVIEPVLAEQADENIRDITGAGDRRVLHREHELAVHADVALGKVGASHLTDQEQRGVVLLRQLLLGQPKDIVVVRAGQTLVARDHDIACPAVFPLGALIEVNMLDLGRMVQDIRDRGADLHKIRLHAVQLLPRPAQLGGRDQIHRVRDLERLLHAVNTGSDLLYACHTALTCSL